MSAPTPESAPPGFADVHEGELRRDLFALAGDSMRGREAGTLDELRASAWVADRAREAGLRPAGDDGTYFQFWPMRRIRTSAASRVSLAGADGGAAALALGRDAAVVAPVNATIDAPILFVAAAGAAGDADVRGRVVATVVTPPSVLPPPSVSLRGYRYALTAVRERVAALADRGASAIVLVADSTVEANFDFVATVLARGRYATDTAGADRLPTSPPAVPAVLVRRAYLDAVRAPGARLVATLTADNFVYPSVNVVAVVPGRDPALRGEYVLFSGHQDHDGVRFPIAGDSIWNGADDNASVSVALLAIGRAVARHPARRSTLFVWHGAEERGLLGSRWYATHPTVPRSAIVAVLNGDMIGRNAPDSAALLGATPPHRNSRALAEAALRANARYTRFALDTTWDRPTHPEFWYFRSDHLPYARLGVPAIFFSTLLHPDYHTPRDEPARIDVAKLARMARWMYATGWIVGNADARPDVDLTEFKLERE